MSTTRTHSLLDWIDGFPRQTPDGVELFLLKEQGIDNAYANFTERKSFWQNGFCLRLGKDFMKDEYSKDFDFWKLVWESVFDPFAAYKYIKHWFISFLLNRIHYPFPDPDFDYIKLLDQKEEDGSLLLFFLPNYFGTRHYGYDPTTISKAFNKGRYDDIFKDLTDDEDNGSVQLLNDIKAIDTALERYSDHRTYIMHQILQSWHYSAMNLMHNRMMEKRVPLLNGSGNGGWLSSDNKGDYYSASANYEQKIPTGYQGKFYIFFKTKGAPAPAPLNLITPYFGHVAWGFSKPGDKGEMFVGGGVEQFTGSVFTKSLKDAATVTDSKDQWTAQYNPVGLWTHEYESAEKMISDFKKNSRADIIAKFEADAKAQRFDPNTTLKGEKDDRVQEYHEIMGEYDQVYCITVPDANPAFAELVATTSREHFYYFGVLSNCLDHTIMIMKLYGVDPEKIPWASTNWTPAKWVEAIKENHGYDYEQIL